MESQNTKLFALADVSGTELIGTSHEVQLSNTKDEVSCQLRRLGTIFHSE